MKETLRGGYHVSRPVQVPYTPLVEGVVQRFTTRTGSRYFLLENGECVRDKCERRWSEGCFRRDRACDRVLFVNAHEVVAFRKAIFDGRLSGFTVPASDTPQVGAHPVLLLSCGQVFWHFDGTTLRFDQPGYSWGVHVGSHITQLDVTPAQQGAE